MAVLKPFRCVRPAPGQAEKTAALPYDVFNEREARIETAANPLSFLNIDRPETQFPEGTDPCGEEVYQMAKELFEEMIRQGIYVEDGEEAYYIYELTMGGRSQTGVVGCAVVDDYLSGVIKKHENTREEKEQDRIRHVVALNAQTGPIFLAYRASEAVSRAVERYKSGEALCDFTAADGVRHRVWKVSGEERIRNLEKLFAAIPAAYIADGHHRAASAVKVCLKRREEHPGYTGEEPFNYFLSVLFPHDQLRILPYNRVVTDWNGLTEEELLEKIRENFLAEKVGKKGVVREKSTHLEVIRMVMDFAESLGFEALNLEFSPIKGPEGNIEYLLYLQNRPEGYESREAGEIRPEQVVEEAHRSL